MADGSKDPGTCCKIVHKSWSIEFLSLDIDLNFVFATLFLGSNMAAQWIYVVVQNFFSLKIVKPV